MNDFLLNLSRVLAFSVVYETRMAIFDGAMVAAFDPQNSVISGTIGAVMGADAQNQATETNAANVAATNAANLAMFEQSRGSTGSAILPIYAAGAENELYNDTLNTYNAVGALDPTGQQYQDIVNQEQPAIAGANSAVAGVFNGATENQELENLAPVNQANLTAVATQKQGTLQALQSTLNNIKSIQAGKGYAGDSFGTQLLNFQARQGANTTASNALSQAQITNAQNTMGVQQNAINRQLQNVNLPFAMASNNANLASMPATSVANNMAQRQQLFNTFRIGTGQFQYQNLPTVQPNSAAYGALSSLGASGNSLASAYIKNPSGVTNLFGGGGTMGVSSDYATGANALPGSATGSGLIAPIGDYSMPAESADLLGAV